MLNLSAEFGDIRPKHPKVTNETSFFVFKVNVTWTFNRRPQNHFLFMPNGHADKPTDCKTIPFFEEGRNYWKRSWKYCGKWCNCSYKQFLCLSQFFQKLSFANAQNGKRLSIELFLYFQIKFSRCLPKRITDTLGDTDGHYRGW